VNTGGGDAIGVIEGVEGVAALAGWFSRRRRGEEGRHYHEEVILKVKGKHKQ
jgi:hypothetical protein